MNKPLQFLIVLLVGLIMGAVCTSIAIEALRKGTEFSRGVMAVQAAHAMALNKLAKDNRCSAPDIQKELLPMRIIAATHSACQASASACGHSAASCAARAHALSSETANVPPVAVTRSATTAARAREISGSFARSLARLACREASTRG